MFELYSLMKRDMVSEVRGEAIFRRQNLRESNGKDGAHGLPNHLQLTIILPLAGDSGRKFGSAMKSMAFTSKMTSFVFQICFQSLERMQ